MIIPENPEILDRLRSSGKGREYGVPVMGVPDISGATDKENTAYYAVQ